MKSVLLSKQPQIVANVLNENSKLLVCKKFPKDFVGWVYIYCTMGKPYLYHEKTNLYGDDIYELTNDSTSDLPNRKHAYTVGNELNGKVVARFWCDKVKYLVEDKFHEYYTEELEENEILKKSCLTYSQLFNYLKGKVGYAIHISKLEVFDKPRKLREFVLYDKNHLSIGNCVIGFGNGSCKRLTKAPKNYCYIEGE